MQQSTENKNVHPDIKTLVGDSGSAGRGTIMTSRIHHLVSYTPRTTASATIDELNRVFGSTGGTLIDAVTPESSGSVQTVAKAFVDTFDENVKFVKSDISVPMILGTVKNACFEVVMEQMLALYGRSDDGPKRLADSMREVAVDHWKLLFRVMDRWVPAAVARGVAKGRDVQEASRESGGYLEETEYTVETFLREASAVGRSVDMHIESGADDDADGILRWMDKDLIQEVMVNLMKPWLVFRFVSAFVPGHWNDVSNRSATETGRRDGVGSDADQMNAAYHDRQYAQLAMYRMTIDTVMSLRRDMHLLAHGSNIIGPPTQIRRNRLIKKMRLSQNYRLTFDIKPVAAARGWRSIIHFSTGGNYPRLPGIWFRPGSLRLHVRSSTFREKNRGRDPSPELPAGVYTNVRVEVLNEHLRVFLNGDLKINLGGYQNPFVSDKPVYVYVGDPWYAAPLGRTMIKNVNYLDMRQIDAKHAVNRLEKMTFHLTESLNNRFTRTGDRELPALQQRVAETSKRSKDLSLRLNHINSELRQRRSKVVALEHNLAQASAKEKRAKMRMMVVIVLTVLAALLFVGLLFFRTNASVSYATGGLIMAAVLLYAARATLKQQLPDRV